MEDLTRCMMQTLQIFKSTGLQKKKIDHNKTKLNQIGPKKTKKDPDMTQTGPKQDQDRTKIGPRQNQVRTKKRQGPKQYPNRT